MKRFSIIIILSLLYCSCKKVQVVIPEAKDTNRHSFLSNFRMSAGPENTENPYDSIGYYHNILLLSCIDSIDLEAAPNSILNVIENVLLATLTEEEILGTSLYGNLIANDSNYSTSIQNAWTYLNSYDFGVVQFDSPLADNYYAYFESYIQNMDSTVTFADFKMEMCYLESLIIWDTSLLELDRKKLLYITSVARYSGYFWSGSDTGNPVPEIFARPWRKYILPDAVGAFGGMIWGPWGAVIGAVVSSALYDVVFPE